MQFLLQWIVYALAIAISAYFLPGIHITDMGTLLILALVFGAINAFLRPVLILLTLPVTLLTFGLFILVINAFLIMLAAMIVPGFAVDGFLWALVFSIILSVISSILRGIAK